MAKDELIDDHVSLNQSRLAVDALLGHAARLQEKKAETELLPGKEQNVWLMVTVKQMQPEKKLKPFKIPIAHPIVDPRVSSVCLITKDPQREYKDLLESQGIRFISRVVGIEKLKGKFKPFEARRMLLKENDLFLADERVVPLLPGLLGKKFFEAKKQPIPVCLTRKDLKGELERAISSTYFHQNQGTCTSVKIGTVSQSSAKVLDNLKMALPAIVKRIKGEWDNIQSFHIKTNSSASMPIWSCDLGAANGARWGGLVAESAEESEAEASEDESEVDGEEVGKDKAVLMEVDGPVPPSKELRKGKKRAAEDITSNTPQKKAKADLTLSPATKTGPKKTPGDAPTTHLPKAPAVAPTAAADGALKKRRRKAKAAAAVDTEAGTAPPETPATGGEKASSTGVPPEPATPTTPVAAKRKRRRASAIDFFEDGAAVGTPAALSTPVPPNTPAAGLTASTPSTATKKRGKAVDASPLKSALEKVASEPSDTSPVKASTATGDTKGAADGPILPKRVRKRKSKAALSAAPEGADAAVPEPGAEATVSSANTVSVEADGDATPPKKVKRKRKRTATEASALAEATGSPDIASPGLVPQSTAPTKDELKKKRSAAGGEKKKEKALGAAPAAKSAKDAVVGKRRS